MYRLAETKEKAQSFLTGLYILVGCAGIEPTTNGLKVRCSMWLQAAYLLAFSGFNCLISYIFDSPVNRINTWIDFSILDSFSVISLPMKSIGTG